MIFDFLGGFAYYIATLKNKGKKAKKLKNYFRYPRINPPSLLD